MQTPPLPRTAAASPLVAPRNRRALPRHHTRATARFQPNALGLGPYCDATLIDISEDGVGFLTSKALAPRTTLTLTLSTSAGRTLEIQAEVRWAAAESSNNKFRIGCRWSRRLSYPELQQFS